MLAIHSRWIAPSIAMSQAKASASRGYLSMRFLTVLCGTLAIRAEARASSPWSMPLRKRLIRRIYPVLPTRLRYVAPYQEALGRLCGRSRPDLMTRYLNHLWIGRECMDD